MDSARMAHQRWCLRATRGDTDRPDVPPTSPRLVRYCPRPPLLGVSPSADLRPSFSPCRLAFLFPFYHPLYLKSLFLPFPILDKGTFSPR